MGTPGNVTTIEAVRGDLTDQDVDAIVNAANPSLAGGGGVDGAIHRAAGPRLVEASRALAPCPPGEARITPGFDLPARHVIHTVGPVWHGGGEGEPEVLARAYRASLALAAQHGLASIAFPSISTGVYGYPIERAAPIAIAAARDDAGGLTLIRFVLFGDTDLAVYRRVLDG